MTAPKNVVAIIPARGGSKGIPRKNVMDFCGKPLIAWSILQSIEALGDGNVYVSTDNAEIAEVSKRFGAKIVQRPDSLATDTASSDDAIIHAIGEIETERPIETVVFLQATSPVRSGAHVRGCYDEFTSGGYDTLFSAVLFEDLCLWKRSGESMDSFSFDYRNRGRRQDREPLFLENGSIYVFGADFMKTRRNRLGGKIGTFAMPMWTMYEIDSLHDVPVCEYFMRKEVL